MDIEIKRFFIYVHFRDSSKERLIKSAKALQSVMKAYFDTNFKVALITQDAIGFVVKTSMHVHGINAALVSPDRQKVNLSGDPIQSEDELLILEIGEHFSVRNLGSVQGWLSAK